MTQLRTVFFGTPAIAVPALRALAETTQLAGVVCQPDRPAGRGMKLSACPVKQTAIELGVEVHQPVRVKTGNLDQWLKQRQVDLAVVLAYGRILPSSVLSAPRLGCVNLHASLLPRYRGAAPINWALAAGETETGMSLMQMDEGLDSGPVFTQRRLSIDEQTNAGALAQALSELAAQMIREDLRLVWEGTEPQPQDPTQATYAPLITSAHLAIDWPRSAREVHNQVRAFAPRPSAHTFVAGKRLRILQTSVADEHTENANPGTVTVASGDQLLVACGRGSVRIMRAQLEGKREHDALQLVNGRTLSAGAELQTESG